MVLATPAPFTIHRAINVTVKFLKWMLHLHKGSHMSPRNTLFKQFIVLYPLYHFLQFLFWSFHFGYFRDRICVSHYHEQVQYIQWAKWADAQGLLILGSLHEVSAATICLNFPSYVRFLVLTVNIKVTAFWY
jgi:hypothetical protein